MVGYWNAPDLTALSLRPGQHEGDRVLSTNDLFTIDDDGDLYFVARNDEVIKTRGEKVSPAEVDAVLFAIDGVREGAVVGVPDDVLGEAIRAYVVLDDGVELSEREIIRFCRERLPLFAVPQQIVFLDDLPKTASGKVRRKSLPL
jgi:acyl-coenzyme A synthetase/AMP-(fatty) acid ligase